MPSTSEKQRRFMGAELTRKRAGKKTQTGMSEKQLSEFAGSVHEHGSLEDITFHEDAVESKTLDLAGFYYQPGEEGHAAQKNHEFMASWESREIKNGPDYKATVDCFGPDTDYRAEEIDPHQYGVDYEPYPFRDYFKTEDDQRERGFRLMEQDEYNETRTPGTIEGDQRTSTAYGARGANSMQKQREVKDRRNFSDQQEFARAVTKKDEEYAVDIRGIDTKRGSKIR